MGADFVVACNVIHKPKERFSPREAKKPKASLFTPILQDSKMRHLTKSSMPPFDVLNQKVNELVRENRGVLENIQKLLNTFKVRFYKKTKEIDPSTPSIFDTIIKAFYAMEYEIAKEKTAEADMVITPRVGQIAALEFYRGKEAIAKGYRAAMKIIPALRKVAGV